VAELAPERFNADRAQRGGGVPNAAYSRGDEPVAPWSPFVIIGAVALALALALSIGTVMRSAVGKRY
jgi:hypothetical protein